MTDIVETLKNFLAHEHGFWAHFPVALITVGAGLRLWWVARPQQKAWDTSEIVLALGAVGSFVSILSGLILTNWAAQLPGVVGAHRTVAMALGAWSLVHLWSILAKPAWAQTRIGAALWALLGAGLVLLAGYLGAEVAER